jgi:transposase
MGRGVRRGLERRGRIKSKAIGIDETSCRKGHDYVAVIPDKDNGRVSAVLPDRKSGTASQRFKSQTVCGFSELGSISVDMSDGFIKAEKENIERREDLICFDRFHVSEHFNQGLDKVRRKEHGGLADGKWKSVLTGSRYGRLRNGQRSDNRESKRRKFNPLTKPRLRTARAWRMKERASTLWEYSYAGVAARNWKELLRRMMQSGIEGMKKAAKMVREHFWGILNAIRLRTGNGMLEAKNNCIQRIKRIACGFRNKARFMTSILFRLGNLDMTVSTL